MDLTNYNLNDDNILSIKNSDGTITFVAESVATDDQKAIIAEFRATYPDGKPITDSLEDAKILKTKEIVNAYNDALTAGFTSSASGTLESFDYSEASQLKLMKLLMAMDTGYLTFPTTVFPKDSTPILLTSVQMQIFFKDVITFELELETKLHTYIGEINSAITVSAVNTIVWS